MKQIISFLLFILLGAVLPAHGQIALGNDRVNVHREADKFATKIAAVNGTLLKDSQHKIQTAQRNLSRGRRGYQAPRTTPEELTQHRLQKLGSPQVSTLYAKQVQKSTEAIAQKIENKSFSSLDLNQKDIAVNMLLPVNCKKYAGNQSCGQSFKAPLLYFAAMNDDATAMHALLLKGASPARIPQIGPKPLFNHILKYYQNQHKAKPGQVYIFVSRYDSTTWLASTGNQTCAVSIPPGQSPAQRFGEIGCHGYGTPLLVVNKSNMEDWVKRLPRHI